MGFSWADFWNPALLPVCGLTAHTEEVSQCIWGTGGLHSQLSSVRHVPSYKTVWQSTETKWVVIGEPVWILRDKMFSWSWTNKNKSYYVTRQKLFGCYDNDSHLITVHYIRVLQEHAVSYNMPIVKIEFNCR